MKKIFITLIIAIFATCINCQTPNKSPSRWSIINNLSDEYNSSTLNNTLWRNANYCHSHEVVTDYTSTNVYFGASASSNDSVLKIRTKQLATPTIKSCNGKTKSFNYESGSIESKKLFQYGFYEISAKLPNTTHSVGSAFWMWYSDLCAYPAESRYGEIDIFENLSNFPYNHVSHIHAGCCGCISGGFDYNWGSCAGYACSCNGTNSNLGFDQTLDFHKYGLDWQPNYLDFYVDDKIIYHVETLEKAQCPSSCAIDQQKSVSYLNIPLRIVFYGYVRTYIHVNRTNTNCGSVLHCDYDLISHPTTSGDIFEIDYFRYFKRNPEIIDIKTNFSTKKTTVTFSSGILGDDYSYSLVPTSSSSTAQEFDDKVIVSADYSSISKITINSLQKTPQQWYNTAYDCIDSTCTLFKCSASTIKDSPNYTEVSSNASFDVQYSNGDLYINNYSSDKIYIANNIHTPYMQSSAIINEGDIIFNVNNSVTLNSGFEVKLGASLLIDPINY